MMLFDIYKLNTETLIPVQTDDFDKTSDNSSTAEYHYHQNYHSHIATFLSLSGVIPFIKNNDKYIRYSYRYSPNIIYLDTRPAITVF